MWVAWSAKRRKVSLACDKVTGLWEMMEVAVQSGLGCVTRRRQAAAEDTRPQTHDSCCNTGRLERGAEPPRSDDARQARGVDVICGEIVSA